jgi:hypothetical protein
MDARVAAVIWPHADFAFMTDGIFPTAMAARPLASEGKLRAVHKKCRCRRTKNLAGTKIIGGDGMLLLLYRRVILWIGRILRCPTKSPMARSDQGV